MHTFYMLIFFYQDELLWGAAWLLRATKDKSYRNFIDSLGANDESDIFSWDNKFAGARVLLSRVTNKQTNFSYLTVLFRLFIFVGLFSLVEFG